MQKVSDDSSEHINLFWCLASVAALSLLSQQLTSKKQYRRPYQDLASSDFTLHHQYIKYTPAYVVKLNPQFPHHSPVGLQMHPSLYATQCFRSRIAS